MSFEFSNDPRDRDGAICELQASAFLLQQGYHVFRNVCSKGPIDIVALKDGVIKKFDVKRTHITKHGRILDRSSHKTGYQIKMNVEVLCVDDGGACYFEDQISQQVISIDSAKTCLQCGKPFLIYRPQQLSKKYYSGKCADLSNRITKENKIADAGITKPSAPIMKLLEKMAKGRKL
jgi:Holliday junction resolvase-like predicted endonuclease